MKNLSKKYLIALISVLSALFIFDTGESFGVNKYIQGKVIYSDDLSPVNNAAIKVFMYSESSKSEIEIENTTVNSRGEFRISVPPETADGIKIMCYPNEESTQSPFEKKIIDFDIALAKLVEKQSIIIEVRRVNNNQFQGRSGAEANEANNKISLKQNFPNPFNPTTLIRFNLPDASKVSLKVYNMSGTNVATLVDNKNLAEGLNEFEFNGGDLPSGIYVYSLKAGNYTENRKMILLK